MLEAGMEDMKRKPGAFQNRQGGRLCHRRSLSQKEWLLTAPKQAQPIQWFNAALKEGNEDQVQALEMSKKVGCPDESIGKDRRNAGNLASSTKVNESCMSRSHAIYAY